MPTNDYYTPLVNAAAGYATLGTYTANSPSGMSYIAPVVMNAIPNSTVIVPQFSAPGYNALQNGLPSGSGQGGYYSLSLAYPESPANCTVYGSRSCY